MKKLSSKDYLNIGIICLIFLLYVYYLLKTGYTYGSTIDWETQHFRIPEYFRTLFYSTKQLIPNFAFNMGAGQNIYNFSYYGLLNPIILISYLLPFIKMSTYIQMSCVVIVIVDVILFYKWIRNRYDSTTSFLATAIFTLASPIIFHSHRHIMFTNYLPFVLISLMGVDKYFEKGKRWLLILGIFLTIMTSYFFSITSIIGIAIYSIFKFLEKYKKIDWSFFYKTGFNLLKYILLSVVLGSIILIPTFLSLVKGRIATNVDLDLISLLLPKINLESALYYAYGFGLTSIAIMALVDGIYTKKKEFVFISIAISLMIIFPMVNYIMNAGMYLNAKVLIPLLPIFVLLIANFIDRIFNNKIKSFKVIIITLLLFLSSYITRTNLQSILYLIDLVIMILIIIFYQKYNKKNIVIIPLVLILISNMFIANRGDILITKIKDDNNLNKIINYVTKKDQDIYRIDNKIEKFANINHVFNQRYYQTTGYSSITNTNYYDFYHNDINNEMGYRNYLMFGSSNNVLFNTFMGNKYVVTNKELTNNYKLVKSINKYNLYLDKNAYSIGYASNSLMSKSLYETLKYPYKMEAISKNIIIDDDKIVNDYSTNIEKINLSYKLDSQEHVSISEANNHYLIEADEGGFVKLKLDEPLIDKILFIRFKMNYNSSCINGYGDTSIKINGVLNKLTCSDGKYHNHNYIFNYVINESNLSELNIIFLKGYYDLSDFEFYYMDNDSYYNTNIDRFVIDSKKTKGDNIYGTINVKNDGYFIIQIPYDDGFNISVDGEKQSYQNVNQGFIGFDITKGNHNITINYQAPGLKISELLSLIGLIIFIFIFIKDERENMKELYKRTFKIYKKHKEIINYLIFGVLTTIVSIASYFLLIMVIKDYKVFGIIIEDYISCTILSWTLALIFAYITNRAYVFESNKKDSITKEFTKFTTSRLLSLGIEVLFMYVTVDILLQNDGIMKLIAQIIVIVLNYILSKLLVFKK